MTRRNSAASRRAHSPNAPTNNSKAKQRLAGFRNYADLYSFITLRCVANNGIDLTGLYNLAAFK